MSAPGRRRSGPEQHTNRSGGGARRGLRARAAASAAAAVGLAAAPAAAAGIAAAALVGWGLASAAGTGDHPGVTGSAPLSGVPPAGAPALVAPTEGTAQEVRNAPYDGRFQLARIRFGPDLRSFGYGRRAPPWAHDYPVAEENLMRVAREVSHLRPSRDGGNVFDLDDPELMRFPIAYLVEVGYWQPSERDVERLREYLLKGGFLIVDDFRGRDWINFEHQMSRVLPEYDMVELDVEEPIFRQFLPMETLDVPHPYTPSARPTYLGIYEDNDPTRRMMVIVNYDQDIGDYWEFLVQGRYPMDPTNDALKLGLNYLFYGMTH